MINYQVEMLNVADADAFIVYYITDDRRKHLVMIDAGRYGNGRDIMNHLNTYYPGVDVELAIVTHPDDDHYGGFVYFLEKIQERNPRAIRINKFWINDPRRHIRVTDVQEDIQRRTLERRLAEVYAVGDRNLLAMLDELHIPHEEQFARSYNRLTRTVFGDFNIPYACSSSQEGFTVLGPTEDFYNEVCKSFRYEKLHVNETTEENDEEDSVGFVSTDESFSKTLDDAGDDGSDHNISSMIVLFQPTTNEKILFTGDACIQSFEHMPAPHKNLCIHVTWLKVPHHGSKANLNTKWIKHFRPDLSYISTLRRGKYLNMCTIFALKNAHSKVISMHNNQRLEAVVYHLFQERTGWSSENVRYS